MARSAIRAYQREWAAACDASLLACEPDERGFILWPLAEYCAPVELRWKPVLQWVRRELRHGR